MRVLIVSHAPLGIYGAITSLGHLLRNIDWEYDLVYPKHYKNNTSEEEIRKFTGYKVSSIYRTYLPYDNAVLGKETNRLRECKDLFLRLRYRISSARIQKIVENGRYDYVLLNSIVLYRMIDKKARYIIYIREMYNRRKKNKVTRKINQAEKVIFIDPALITPLKEIVSPYCVINNPFDMTGMKALDRDQLIKQYPMIKTDRIVIMIAGVLAEIKGIRFVIKAFRKVSRDDMQLIIVGDGAKEYVKECRQLAQGDDRIAFLGMQTRIQEIYLLTDYLLTAGHHFATGRTIYEGLFAGCNVIIQSDSENDKSVMQEYERYSERIHFYHTRNEEDLKNVFENLPPEKVTVREYRSNIDEYIARIKHFLETEKSDAT